MNILPFRTRMDKPASARTLRQAWLHAVGPQIVALDPDRIIALGKQAWNVLSRQELPNPDRLILFKRGIGDSYIPQESQDVLRQLAQQQDGLA